MNSLILIYYKKGLNEKPLTSDNSGIAETRGIILTITLVAGVLLVLNVILISCYVRRKAKRNGNYYIPILMCFFLLLNFQIPLCLLCPPPRPPCPRPRPWTWWWAWQWPWPFWFCWMPFFCFVSSSVKPPRVPAQPRCPRQEKIQQPQPQRVKIWENRWFWWWSEIILSGYGNIILLCV